MKTSTKKNSDRTETGRAHPAPLRCQTEVSLAIFLCSPDCSLKQWQLSTETLWILLVKSKREWSIKENEALKTDTCPIRNNSMSPTRRAGGGSSGCEWKQEGDRQTDIFANPQIFFFSPLHFLISIHIMIFSSNISPGFYGAFMFSFPSLPVCSISCLCLLIRALNAWLIYHIYMKASVFLPCRHQGCNISPKATRLLSTLSSFSRHLHPVSPSFLLGQSTKPESRWLRDHNCFNLLVTFTYISRPPLNTGMRVIFQFTGLKACQSGRWPIHSLTGFIQ